MSICYSVGNSSHVKGRIMLNSKTAILLSSVFFSLVIATTGAQAQDKSERASLECGHLFPIEQIFLTNHVHFTISNRDKELEVRVVDQYIKRIDASKIYLLQSDVEKVKTFPWWGDTTYFIEEVVKEKSPLTGK